MFTNQLCTAGDQAEWRLGVVVSLESEEGILTLFQKDGSYCRLHADPGVLQDLRIGKPVQALIEDTTVLSLRRL